MQRTDERETGEVDVEHLLDDPGEESGERQSSGQSGLRDRLPSPRVPSPRSILLSAALVAAAFVVASFLLPFGVVGGLAGVVAAGFALGLVGRGRYPELALAGAFVGGAGAVLGNLFLSLVGNVAVPMVAVGAGAGVGAAVLGHYLGRDLRAGLTREL